MGRAVPGELQEADFLEVVVERVRLGVERDIGLGPLSRAPRRRPRRVRIVHKPGDRRGRYLKRSRPKEGTPPPRGTRNILSRRDFP